VWIGSADAMHRNLDRRVEAMARVRDTHACARLDRMLDLAISDTVGCWTLSADCSWLRQATQPNGEPRLDYQSLLIAGHGGVPEVTTTTETGTVALP
jgi:polyphosphate kinase